jgi:hypothetical protein
MFWSNSTIYVKLIFKTLLTPKQLWRFPFRLENQKVLPDTKEPYQGLGMVVDPIRQKHCPTKLWPKHVVPDCHEQSQQQVGMVHRPWKYQITLILEKFIWMENVNVPDNWILHFQWKIPTRKAVQISHPSLILCLSSQLVWSSSDSCYGNSPKEE